MMTKHNEVLNTLTTVWSRSVTSDILGDFTF